MAGHACVIHKNLVYDLSRHESSIAKWLECPKVFWKVIGSTPVEELRNLFFWVIRPENASSFISLKPNHHFTYNFPSVCHYNNEQVTLVVFKCHWDQIVDIHFFTFSCTISLSERSWTFISENLRPPLIFLVPVLVEQWSKWRHAHGLLLWL